MRAFDELRSRPECDRGGHVSANTQWIGTVRGRIGYLFTPELLAYGTGGLAYGGVNATATHSALVEGSLSGLNPPYSGFNGPVSLAALPGSGHASGARAGWTAGGGVEWMFAQNWSLKGEALYYSLGDVTLNSSPVIAASPVAVSAPPYLAIASGQALIANRPATRVSYDGVILRAGVNYHF